MRLHPAVPFISAATAYCAHTGRPPLPLQDRLLGLLDTAEASLKRPPSPSRGGAAREAGGRDAPMSLFDEDRELQELLPSR